ncbi:ubiquitin carboxyl-terminal hydrolase 2-like isoform X2 [Actinia tenebrosa]|uniref:ubiquitinyl hydrolase 1 n=1 Tax=Actinia tenebrosa TaxID=6105 RepID=A0A6P8IRI1_ACTTE|nr:ubiquitin carboxyl-terminal hydrolase 2-like isoform X2 [Actinia tenebrosa]
MPNGRGCLDGLIGLRNLGNTCFMNSILQCLSQSMVLTEYMLKGSYTKQINSRSSMKGKLVQAYAELIKSMWKPSHSETAISPHSFKTQIQRFAPRFVGYNQQDAQEFLRFLLEGLHDDLNSVHDKPKYKICEFNDLLSDTEKADKSWKQYLARDNSKITDLFVGQLKSTLKCTECGHKSVTFDPFWDLSLPIPRKSSSSYSSYESKSISIQNCMELFAKEEVLDGDERPTCEKCKKKRKSTKKFTIQRFPQILVLHLKRFSGFGFRSKLQTNVDFPTDTKLDLKEFASDNTDSKMALYSLYAVSNHSGTTYGGHYTAYCKHPLSNEWHCFNDSSVDNIPASRIGGPQAYILFYNRMDAKSSL